MLILTNERMKAFPLAYNLVSLVNKVQLIFAIQTNQPCGWF